MSSLYILNISSILDVGLVKIFSQSVGCLYALLTVSFAIQKLCNFMRFHLSIVGAGSTSGKHVEECKLIHSYFLYKAQVQVDQGLSHKTRYTETNRKWGRASSTRAHGKIS